MFNMVSEPNEQEIQAPTMGEEVSDNTAAPLVENTSTSLASSSVLISINAAAQLPLFLTPMNFPSWRAQFHSLLLGYDLT